jgi:hypothetical protein
MPQARAIYSTPGMVPSIAQQQFSAATSPINALGFPNQQVTFKPKPNPNLYPFIAFSSQPVTTTLHFTAPESLVNHHPTTTFASHITNGLQLPHQPFDLIESAFTHVSTTPPVEARRDIELKMMVNDKLNKNFTNFQDTSSYGAKCGHRNFWKRLRTKKGFAYYVCFYCQKRWRYRTNPESNPNSAGSCHSSAAALPTSAQILHNTLQLSNSAILSFLASPSMTDMIDDLEQTEATDSAPQQQGPQYPIAMKTADMLKLVFSPMDSSCTTMSCLLDDQELESSEGFSRLPTSTTTDSTTLFDTTIENADDSPSAKAPPNTAFVGQELPPGGVLEYSLFTSPFALLTGIATSGIDYLSISDVDNSEQSPLT